MAKKGFIERNNKRKKLSVRFAARRKALKEIAGDRSRPAEERLEARLKLAALPRNAAPIRVRNICELTGRTRSTYRKFRLSRIKLRELAAQGLIPGMVKSSW